MFGGENCYFFGDINTNRAPGDAASTAYTAGRSELIVPRCELMSQPLTVARPDIVANHPAVHGAEIRIKARIPLAMPLDVFHRQIRHFRDGTAETGRTDHRAVRA